MTLAMLMVGATGMLAETALGLAEEGHLVHLVSRTRSRFDALREREGKGAWRLSFHPADYTSRTAFKAALEEAWEDEPFETVVLWGSHPAAFATVTEVVTRLAGQNPWRLFFIRGSQYRNAPPPAVPEGCAVRLVILGFVLDRDGCRWLTHHEIGSGVLEAIRADHPRSVIGVVEPWERRPAY